MKNLLGFANTPLYLLALCALLFAQLSGCAINPVSGERDLVLMTEKQEIDAGGQYHREILKQYRVYDDPKLQAYIQRIGSDLAKNSHRASLDFHFTVLDSPEVNAFALPGGYVYITRGIMAYLNSEAELAGVLGHEIGHVTARHSVRQQSASQVTSLLGGILNVAAGQDPGRGLFSQLGVALTRGYGRDHELEADRLGAQYLARVGYAPKHMIDVIGVLKNQALYEEERARQEGREARAYHGLFASHPKHDKRLRKVIDAAQQFHSGQSRDAGRERYLQHIDGLPFGQNAADGIVRGNAFYHAGLDVKLLAPKNWQIENLPDRLLFIAPRRDALLRVERLPRPQGKAARTWLLNHLKRQSLDNPRTLSAKGMRGYSGSTVDETPFGRRKVRYSVWLRDKDAWLFAATTREHANFDLLEPIFDGVVTSLDKLTTRERQLAQPLRLKLIHAPAGARYRTLAARTPLGQHAEAQLRLLNADYPSGKPKSGTLVKIVE